MTADDYAHATAIARRACAGWSLTREDWEDICQEAALRAWRTPDHPGTAAWWGARESAERILRTRRKSHLRLVELDRDYAAPSDVEAEVVGQVMVGWLLAAMPAVEREPIVLLDVEDRRWVEVESLLGVPDGTVARRRVRGLARARQVLGCCAGC